MPARKIAPVAKKGDRAETLRVLRDRIAFQLDETDSARDVAALAQRLLDVERELAELKAPAATSPADQIAARRAARQASA